MRGVGMSYGRLLRVPYMYATVLALVNLAIVGYIQPRARYAYEGLRFELRTGALGASIKVGEFTTLKDRVTLRIDESRDEGSAQEEDGGRQHERRENRGARIEPGNPRTARPGLGHLPVRDE